VTVVVFILSNHSDFADFLKLMCSSYFQAIILKNPTYKNLYGLKVIIHQKTKTSNCFEVIWMSDFVKSAD